MPSHDSPPPPERHPGPGIQDPTAAVLLELTRTVQPEARAQGESMVLEYGRPFKWFAGVLWLLIAGAMVAIALTAKPGQREALFGLAGFFLLLVLVLHLEFFGVSIRYDTYGLQTKSPWRRGRMVPWEDITGVTFSQAAQWYALSTTRYGRVRVHFWLSGLQSLFTELKRRGLEIPPADLVYKKW